MRHPTALLLAFAFLGSCNLAADDLWNAATWGLGGHLKYQATMDRFPQDSAWRDLLGSSSAGQKLTARLNGKLKLNRWDFNADVQFIALHADSIRAADSPYPLPAAGRIVTSDDRRWWDLGQTFSEGTEHATVGRFDRLYVGYSSNHMVWRLDRRRAARPAG